MAKKSKGKYYVVWVGVNPGIYETWSKCQEQIVGFPNARYKSFKTLAAAEEAFDQSASEFIIKKKKAKSKSKPDYHSFLDEIEENSISVDAACSRNPGIMEYRGVETYSAEEIFRLGPFDNGTNNVGEFLALVHALAYLKKAGDNSKIIYTDSRTALSWVRNKRVKTTLKQTQSNRQLFTLLNRAINWLKTNDYKTKIVKWDTDKWGEIPADFGRK